MFQGFVPGLLTELRWLCYGACMKSGPKLRTVSDLDAEKVEAAIAQAFEGKTYSRIIETLGISSDLFLRLRNADAAFNQRFIQAREAGGEAILESLLTLVEDNPDLDPNLLRIKAECTRFYVVKAFPNKYGDRLEVKHALVDIGSAIADAKQRVIDITPRAMQLEANSPFD